jgi:hypothetical protein
LIKDVSERFNRLDKAEEDLKQNRLEFLEMPNRKDIQKYYKEALKIRNDILEELRA